MKTVKEFTCLAERVSVGRGCDADVAGGIRFWLLRFWEFGKLLYGKRLPLKWADVVFEKSNIQVSFCKQHELVCHVLRSALDFEVEGQRRK